MEVTEQAASDAEGRRRGVKVGGVARASMEDKRQGSDQIILAGLCDQYRGTVGGLAARDRVDPFSSSSSLRWP